MSHQVGYCCINTTLGKMNITTGRTMRQATFREDRDLTHTSVLALANAKDLVAILHWNVNNNVHVFRIGSNIFPWNSEYELYQLPNFKEIADTLHIAGTIVKDNNMRVSFHPDHYVKLASAKETVANNAIHDLHHHNEIFDLMGIPATHYFPLNIHVGQNFSFDVVDRFISRFHQLNNSTQRRLVVENDDKANAFSVRQLYDHIFTNIQTPITFDYFHHTFHPDDMSSRDAAYLAASTWDVKPLFHYSESKNLNEHVNGNPRAHSDYAFQYIDDYDLNIDIDLEIKAKELAWFKYQSLALI